MYEGALIGGKYRVTARIGAGGMGTVFEGIHLVTEGKVAIKLLSPQDLREEIVQRFEREAKAASAVESQHIARVFDMGSDELLGMPYMVMERLSGEDLSSVLRRFGCLPVDTVLRIAAQVLLGLQKAHAAGVVHRDIKPANLFLARGDDGALVVKLLDFGIAKVTVDQLHDRDGDLTQTGSMLGSPQFMSPEQAQGLRTIDHRTDLYSLGVVIYKALTGRFPHDSGDALGQIILAICSQEPAFIQDVAPWISPEVAQIVHRALSRAPEARFESAASMLEAIKPLLADGWALREDRVRSASESERSLVAARAQEPNPSDTHAAAVEIRAPAPSLSATDPSLATGLGLTRGPGAWGRRMTLPLLALTTGVALSVAWISSRSMGEAVPVRPESPVDPAPRGPPPPETASLSYRLPLAGPRPLTLRVDDVPVVENEGGITISGPLGSMHTVHLSHGGVSRDFSVAITEQGLLPGAIEFVIPEPPRKTAAPSVTPLASHSGRATRPPASKQPHDDQASSPGRPPEKKELNADREF